MKLTSRIRGAHGVGAGRQVRIGVRRRERNRPSGSTRAGVGLGADVKATEPVGVPSNSEETVAVRDFIAMMTKPETP